VNVLYGTVVVGDRVEAVIEAELVDLVAGWESSSMLSREGGLVIGLFE
jgi:hypothetical protein